MKTNKLGITEGEFVIDDNYEGFVLTDMGAYRPNAMMQATESRERIKATAALFANAANTANKCGKLPSELLEERDLLLDFVNRIQGEMCRCDFVLDERWERQAQKLINKIEE